MTSGVQSKGGDIDSIFDPYVVGTSPGITGIQSAGADIHTRYAPLIYGSAAAATGIACMVGGAGSFVDLNTLFAAHGTANYDTPENGDTFNSDAVSSTPSGTVAQLQLVFTDAAHYVVQDRGTTINSFTVPAGMTKISCVFTHESGNAAPTAVGTPSLTNMAAGTYATLNSGSNSGTPNTKTFGYSLYVQMANSSGTVVYTGTSTWSLTSQLT